MNFVLILRSLLLIACLMGISIGYVMAEEDDSAYIYGTPPTTGNILLKLVNNEDSLDMVAVITKGGDKTPLLALYIASSDIGSIPNMGKGRYDVYFTTGIDWNEQKSKFNDGNFYKLRSPLILGSKDEYQVPLYADQKKMGTQIRFIEKSIFPDISGAAYSSNGDDSTSLPDSEDNPK